MIFNTIIKGKGGITGEPIEVAELPTPSADTVGKVYAVDAKVKPEVGQVVGDKLYFDTSKNPLDYSLGSAIVMGNTNDGVHCTYVDFFALQGITGMGHCYAIAVATPDMSVFLGVAYVYCDVLTVDQFNANVGASLGLSITEFGWQTDVVDITSIQDRKITSVYEEYDFVKVKGKEYYIGITDNSFRVDEPVGDKIYFDTTKNPTNYLAYMDKCLVGISNGTNTYYLAMVDVLAAQGVTGYGHCYALAISTQDMSTILGIVYIYCDVLNVAQFNQMIGSQFGLTITEFGWQTNVLDISAIADYEVIYNFLANWDFLAYGNSWYEWELSNQTVVDNVTAEKDAEIANVTAEKDAEIANVTAEKDAEIAELTKYKEHIGDIFFDEEYPHSCQFAGWRYSTITLSDKVKSLLQYTFFRATANVQWESENSSTTSIQFGAFYNWAGTTTIELPPSITEIQSQAFYGCQNLVSITIKATTPPTLGGKVFYGCYALTAIYVPAESVEAYKTADGWSEYADIIQADPSTIATVTVNYTVDGSDHGVMGDTAPETVAYGSEFNFQVDCEQGYAVDANNITVTGATLASTRTVYEPDGVTVVPESLLLYFTDVTGDVTINVPLRQY